jgi:hypothetical protein
VGGADYAVDENNLVNRPGYRRDWFLLDAALIIEQRDMRIEIAPPLAGLTALYQFFPQSVLKLQQSIIVVPVAG